MHLPIVELITNKNTVFSEGPCTKDKLVITSTLASNTCQRQMLVSTPEPLHPSTLTLLDGFGNGGFQAGLYQPPLEAYSVHQGPFLPLESAVYERYGVSAFGKLA